MINRRDEATCHVCSDTLESIVGVAPDAEVLSSIMTADGWIALTSGGKYRLFSGYDVRKTGPSGGEGGGGEGGGGERGGGEGGGGDDGERGLRGGEGGGEGGGGEGLCRQTRPLARLPKETQKKSIDAVVVRRRRR